MQSWLKLTILNRIKSTDLQFANCPVVYYASTADSNRTKISFGASKLKGYMNRQNQLINDRYEALMFAKTPEAGRKAARELVRTVLGEEALQLSLEEALRQCCRRLRPSKDPREQARFEAEFIELGVWPNESQRLAA